MIITKWLFDSTYLAQRRGFYNSKLLPEIEFDYAWAAAHQEARSYRK